MASDLTLSHLSKRYASSDGQTRTVFEDFTLHVGRGSFVSILGGNGYGKSTLLRTISGMEAPSGGQILLDGAPPEQLLGRVGLVCQEVDLYPWRTALENVAFGLEIQNVQKPRREALARAYLKAFGLEAFADCYPRELSGGMRQKVAIARTLVTSPDIILMDEPFSALDYQTRAGLQCFLLHLWAKRRETILFVTHDVEEAVFLSDYIVILSPVPTHILDIIPVTLPRPRPRAGVETAELRSRVMELYGNVACPNSAELMRSLEAIAPDALREQDRP